MNFRNPSGIYIHIPFCNRKCNYCNFYSIAKPTELLIWDYITCLINEITQTSLNYAGLKNEINTVYFGGGTPSLLNEQQLKQVFSNLENSFDFNISDCSEVTIEVNPGTVDKNYLKMLKEIGFNRISIGVQSLNDRLLKLMGRIHSAQEGIQTIEQAYQAGFNNISADIIFNYPTQNKEDVLNSLDILTNLPGIQHISAYSLQVEPNTVLARKIKKGGLFLNKEDEERNIYYSINKFLKNRGFEHYEISNYARFEFESQQNNLYWKLGSYYGFGPASSAFLVNQRIDHPPDLQDYLKSQGNQKSEIMTLTEHELKEEFMFLGLRRLAGVNDREYRQLFSSSFFNDFKKAICNLLKDKMIEIKEETVKLTQKGIDFADRVALEFLL